MAGAQQRGGWDTEFRLFWLWQEIYSLSHVELGVVGTCRKWHPDTLRQSIRKFHESQPAFWIQQVDERSWRWQHCVMPGLYIMICVFLSWMNIEMLQKMAVSHCYCQNMYDQCMYWMIWIYQRRSTLPRGEIGDLCSCRLLWVYHQVVCTWRNSTWSVMTHESWAKLWRICRILQADGEKWRYYLIFDTFNSVTLVLTN